MKQSETIIEINPFIEELQIRQLNNFNFILDIINRQFFGEPVYISAKSRICSLTDIENILGHPKYKTHIDLCIFITDMTDYILKRNIIHNSIKIITHFKNDEIIILDYLKAITLGLIINELIAYELQFILSFNRQYIKHKIKPEIKISIKRTHGINELIISNNIVASHNFNEIIIEKHANINDNTILLKQSSSMKFVKNLIDNINGKIKVDLDFNKTYTIEF